jgi:hypothetical protein
MLGPQVLAALRENISEAAPTAIRFAAGPLPAPTDLERAERATPAEPSSEDVAEAAELTSSLADAELRDLVARAAAASLARARSDRRF